VTDPRPRGPVGADGPRPARRRQAVAGRRAAVRRTLDARAQAATPETAERDTAGPDTPELGSLRTESVAATPAEAARGAAVRADRTGAEPTELAVTSADKPVRRSLTERAASVLQAGPLVTALIGVIVVATVAALVLAGLLGYEKWEAGQLAETRRGAQAAADPAARDILSYDHRHLEQDFAKGRTHLTGQFAKDYDQTTSKGVAELAKTYKAVVRAEVMSSSVVSATRDRVVLLMFVNQVTTSTRVEGPKLDQNRVRLTLEKVDGRWLVSELDAL
jgi:Mce-associated membrane protein